MAENEQQAGTLVWDLATGHQLFQQGLQAAGSALGQFAGVVKSTNFLMVGGMVALGVAAFKAAQKSIAAIVGIDSALREVATLLPETAEQLGFVRRELIALSTQVPQPPELLTQATYQAISAGFTELGDALDIVSVSAKAAVAGLTDTFTAVDAITTALNAYQLDATEAGHVSDVFFKTVEQGKVRFEELASSFGTVATTAALGNVSLEETNAAIATLTKFGIDAAEATTSLNRAILSIIKPTKAQIEAAKKYGVELSATALETKGFTGVLQELEQATHGNVEALAEIFPNIRAARSVFVLAGNGADEYRRILLEVSNSAGATQAAFEDMNGSLQNQRALLANNINALWASLGNVLLPGVVRIVEGLNRLFETQTETLRRLAEAQGDYVRATELAQKIRIENYQKELLSLERRFKELNLDQQLNRPGPLRQLFGLDNFGISAELDEILTKQFDINDGWENIESSLRDIIARSKDQITQLREEGRLNDDLEEQIRQRIDVYSQLLGISQAFLDNEQALGEETRARTKEERAVARIQERLQQLQRFAPADSELLKNERERLRIAKAREALAASEKDQNYINTQLKIRGVDLSGLELKTVQDLTKEESERVAQFYALRGLTEQEINDQQERLNLELQYISALIVEKQAREALAGDQTFVNLEAMIREARLQLLEFYEEQRKTPVLEAFAEGLTGEERLIFFETIDLMKQKLDEWIKLAARARVEGWTQVFIEMNEEAKKADESVKLQAARLRQWLNAGLKGKDLVDLMKEYKIDIDAVSAAFPELGAAIRAAMNKQPVEELLDSIVLLVRGLGEFSNALGAISNSAVRAINQVGTLVEGVSSLSGALKKIQAGTYQGGVLGILGPIGGIIGGLGGLVSLGSELFGGGPSPEELQQRQTIVDNTNALRRLRDSVERQISALQGLQSGDFAAVADALKTFTDFGGAQGVLTQSLVEFANEFFSGTGRTVEEILSDLGINLDALQRAAESVGIELPTDDLKLFEDGLKKVAKALRELDLDILRQSYQGAKDWATLVAEVFDEELTPQKEFDILREAILKAIPDLDALTKLANTPDDQLDIWGRIAKQISPDFYAKLFGDINDPETVQAWEDFSQFLVENFDELFKAGFFGGLNPTEAMGLLSDIDNNTDKMQELLKDAQDDQGIQAISAINRITTEQADIMIALDSTRNFYLEQIRDSTGAMLEAMNGGSGLLPPSAASVSTLGYGNGVTIEEINMNFDITGQAGEIYDQLVSRVTTEFVPELDSALGDALRKQRLGFGFSPRRNQ